MHIRIGDHVLSLCHIPVLSFIFIDYLLFKISFSLKFVYRMFKWLRFTIFLLVLGLGKTHHMIRLVVLAAMGLAGLWMLHTLAQDFNKIYNNLQQQQQHSAADPSHKLFVKRSIDNSSRYLPDGLTEVPEVIL